MSNLIVDGMATYGQGNATDALEFALLSGAYAEIGTSVSTILPGSCQIQQGLDWDPTDTSFWINGRNPTGGANSGIIMAARRAILQGAKATVVISCRIALSELPGSNNDAIILDLRDGGNTIMGQLYVSTTGVLVWKPVGGSALQSSAPVIFAETAHHIEGKWNMGTGAVTIKVDETTAVSGTATYGAAASVAQFAIAGCNLGGGLEHDLVHMTDFILRDTSGSFNNDFVGDRRVATLYPNTDDLTFAGWAAAPLQRFNVGILDNTDANSCIGGPASSVGSIGSGDFTIEGNFRLQTALSGSDKAVLAGKWTEDTNQRSWQLYQGGPDLENGLLVFRTSTDGQSGTVSEKLKWPWNPVPEQWYHVAVVRSGTSLRLFIDGVQAGVTVTDSDTYFATSARAVLGGQLSSVNVQAAGTYWPGWQDEYRLTIGACRYTANFSPPTEEFPRGIGDDPNWASVAWLSGWDNSAIADDGPNGITLTAFNGSTWLTPNDGEFAYETINKPTPSEDTFIEAALLAATGILTFSGGNAANNETVTCATKDGAAAAVYTFKTSIGAAYTVLVGATVGDSVQNLIDAINRGSGEGTTYGTGTGANNDVQAELLPTGQMQVTALVPGTVGNALASTETCAHASWGAATLAGGANIPAASAFYFEHLPPEATIVDSITLVGREYKTDAGTAKIRQTLLGSGGGTIAGTEYTMGTTPILKYDTFEEDPDNPGSAPTPVVVRTMRAKINRTA